MANPQSFSNRSAWCTRAPRQKSRQQVNSILARRERLVTDIARLRDHGQTSRFIENAQQLLTRCWSSATWEGREKLLKSADWLLRLEQRRGDEGLPSV